MNEKQVLALKKAIAILNSIPQGDLSVSLVASPLPTATDPVAGVSEIDWWLNHFARRDTHLTTLTTKECVDRVKAKREHLGRIVREAWVTWASLYPSSKPSWLVPYDELSESDKEADRRIGKAVFRDTLAALRARPTAAGVSEIEALATNGDFQSILDQAHADSLPYQGVSIEWCRKVAMVTLAALRARPNEGTFAEGIEAAALKAEDNKLYWAAKVDPLSDLPSREIFRAKSAACFQVEMDIRSLTVPEKKGIGE